MLPHRQAIDCGQATGTCDIFIHFWKGTRSASMKGVAEVKICLDHCPPQGLGLPFVLLKAVLSFSSLTYSVISDHDIQAQPGVP